MSKLCHQIFPLSPRSRDRCIAKKGLKTIAGTFLSFSLKFTEYTLREINKKYADNFVLMSLVTLFGKYGY